MTAPNGSTAPYKRTAQQRELLSHFGRDGNG